MPQPQGEKTLPENEALLCPGSASYSSEEAQRVIKTMQQEQDLFPSTEEQVSLQRKLRLQGLGVWPAPQGCTSDKHFMQDASVEEEVGEKVLLG